MDAYSLGQYLKQAREAKELTIQQAEDTLKIRRFILEAFEQGDFNALDVSPVQIRGFLRNYARFIGLEEDTVIQYYEGVLTGETRRRGRRLPPPAAASERPSPNRSAPIAAPTAPQRATGEYLAVRSNRRESRRIRRRQLFNRLVALIAALAAISVIAFVVTQLVDFNANQTDPTPEPTLNVAAGGLPTLTPTPPVTPMPLGTATLEIGIVQAYNGEPVLVSIAFRQRTWVRVTVDGADVFTGLVRPNELVIEQRANNEIQVEASNALALGIVYNGMNQPAFGNRGQSVMITFRPNNNVQVIGGNIELTPTNTPEPRLTEVNLLDGMTPISTLETDVQGDGPTLTPTIEPTPMPSPTVDPSLPTSLPLLGVPTNTPAPTVETVITSPPDNAAGSSVPAATPTPANATSISPETPIPSAVVPPRLTPVGATPTKPPRN